MNHCVPDFEMDEDYSIPTSSGLTSPKKSPIGGEEEIMELLWQNGQVVMQSQNQRSHHRRAQIRGDAVLPAEREIRPEEVSTAQLFMQEDEMASWLNYPIDDSSFDRDFYNDLIYQPPPPTAAPASPISGVRIPPPCDEAAGISRPPIPTPRREHLESSPRFQNFGHFSKPKGRAEAGPSCSNRVAVRETTVVDSNETPAAAPESRASQFSGAFLGFGSVSGAAAAGTSSAAGRGTETGTCELTVTSSPGGSGASVSTSAELVHKAAVAATEDRKRKGREGEDGECQSEVSKKFSSPSILPPRLSCAGTVTSISVSTTLPPNLHLFIDGSEASERGASASRQLNAEDVEIEYLDAKKQGRGSTSTKRSRAAEVHNLSERRRRDRINEKMRALQELIPRCNKSDKASMLDEAIEYLKSLQLQVQMMSMGCSMVPMMFPGVQQYMPQMGMGMGIGIGMEMGMNRPMMQFPSVLAGSALPTAAAAAHLGPRFPVPAFAMPPVPLPDPSRIQATSQSDHLLNPLGTQNPNQPRMPNFPDPYQQYLCLHQTQVPPSQNQAMMQPNTSKPSSSREVRNGENFEIG